MSDLKRIVEARMVEAEKGNPNRDHKGRFAGRDHDPLAAQLVRQSTPDHDLYGQELHPDDLPNKKDSHLSWHHESDGGETMEGQFMNKREDPQEVIFTDWSGGTRDSSGPIVRLHQIDPSTQDITMPAIAHVPLGKHFDYEDLADDPTPIARIHERLTHWREKNR